MSERRLAVVILHYGDPDLTERVKEQLKRTDPQWTENLFVLDNHAPCPFPDSWLRLEENLYWAGALDYCLNKFSDMGYSHLWFLNNDILFGSKSPHIQRAWKRLEFLDSCLGPVGVYSPSTYRNQYHPQMLEKPEMQYSTVPYIDGIAPLFRIESLKSIGGLDYEGNQYGYGVDVWNTLQLHRAGCPVVVDHQVVVKHIYHSTAKKEIGFLATASRFESEYMTKRLGDNYKLILKEELTRCRDFATF